MGNKFKLSHVWPPAAVMIGLLLVWQLVTAYFSIEEWILPSPWAIWTELMKEWPRLMEHAAATIQMTLLGFGAGTAAGFVLAALLHLIPGARTALYPLLVLTQNIPLIVLADLLVIWFGFGVLPKLILLILVCFFPVCVSMLTGLRQADEKLVTYMRMIGATRRQLFWRLELPGAISYLFAGLKIAASYCVISAIYAETIGSSKGLGVFIRLASHGWQTSRVFAGIIVIVTLSLLLFGLITLTERLLIRWQVHQEGGEHR